MSAATVMFVEDDDRTLRLAGFFNVPQTAQWAVSISLENR